jgi:hypothetical protein
MGRIRDLIQYLGAINRTDVWFMVDGDSFQRGQKMSAQQIYTLCKGADGQNVLIQNNGTYIQWKLQSDASWTNLIQLSSLKGVDGKQLEIQVAGGYIQTRLTGGTWVNLVAIADLKGDKGADALPPNFSFQITALASNAAPTAQITGTYPNLTVALGIPKGQDASPPNIGFSISALSADAEATASVTGTYPNLIVNLGIPKGHDAPAPIFALSAEGKPAGTVPEVESSGTYPNLSLNFKIPKGADAVNPNLSFQVTALASDATPTANVTGTYPNLTVALGIPKGQDALQPNIGFSISALSADAEATASVTGTYPNVIVNLGIPKGHDALEPAFTFTSESKPAGTSPEVIASGDYPNIALDFKIPAGFQGETGKPLVVLPNGNYGNWDNGLGQYVDSGVYASATLVLETTPVTFTQAEIRANIQSGEGVTTIFGKIKKWFADLGTLAFKNTVDWMTDIANKPANVSDFANDSDYQSAGQVTGAVNAAVADVQSDIDGAKADLLLLFGNDDWMGKAIIGIKEDYVAKTDVNNDFTTDVDFSVSGDTVIAEQFYKNPATGQTKQIDKNIPLADDTHAGLMAREDVASLAALLLRVGALEGKSSRYAVTIPDAPSQSNLTALYQAASGSTEAPPDSTRLVDVQKNVVYTWFETDSTWYGPESDTVSLFSNLVAGILIGAAEDGKIYAEADGKGSVYGWDALKTLVNNINTALGNHADNATVHVTSLERTAWNGKVDSVGGMGLSANDFGNDYKALADFQLKYSTVTSLANVPVDGQIVYANIGSNQSLSVTGTPIAGQPTHVFVKNTAATAYTITIPTTGSYLSMSGASKSLPASGYLEIDIVYNSNTAKYCIKVMEAE